MATEDRPAARTHADGVAEGKLVASGRKTCKESAFVDVDVFSELLPGWNKVKHNKYDLAHELGNIVKHIFTFIRNRKGSKGAILFNPRKLQVGHHCHAFAHTLSYRQNLF
jgi:predicted ATP-dependent Lon-type protease